MASHFDLSSISSPAITRPLTSVVHSDVYPAISPAQDLSGSAKGLRVLITGSGRGIGRAVAIACAEAGAIKVVLTSRSQGELEEVENAINTAVGEGNVEVIKVTGSVCKREDVEKLFETAGDLDVLVNNAGALEKFQFIHKTDPDEWLQTQEINTKGTYLPTREFLNRNLGRPLTIINTSSVCSMATLLGLSSYCPGKTMINRFTEFLHFEYRVHDVRAFAYHPGVIRTKLTSVILPDQGIMLDDTPELAAGFALWLITQGDKVDFLRGRFLSANWDVDELLAKKDEILRKGLLWTRVVGQEQELEPSSVVL